MANNGEGDVSQICACLSGPLSLAAASAAAVRARMASRFHHGGKNLVRIQHPLQRDEDNIAIASLGGDPPLDWRSPVSGYCLQAR
jgi:hypothetical protein